MKEIELNNILLFCVLRDPVRNLELNRDLNYILKLMIIIKNSFFLNEDEIKLVMSSFD